MACASGISPPSARAASRWLHLIMTFRNSPMRARESAYRIFSGYACPSSESDFLTAAVTAPVSVSAAVIWSSTITASASRNRRNRDSDPLLHPRGQGFAVLDVQSVSFHKPVFAAEHGLYVGGGHALGHGQHAAYADPLPGQQGFEQPAVAVLAGEAHGFRPAHAHRPQVVEHRARRAGHGAGLGHLPRVQPRFHRRLGKRRVDGQPLIQKQVARHGDLQRSETVQQRQQPFLRHGLFPLQKQLCQIAHRVAVAALHVIAFAPVGHGARHDGFPRAEIIARVGLGGSSLTSFPSSGSRSNTAVVKWLMTRPPVCDVSAHGEGL